MYVPLLCTTFRHTLFIYMYISIFNGNLFSNIHIIFFFFGLHYTCQEYIHEYSMYDVYIITCPTFIPNPKSYISYEILSQKWVLWLCLICSVQSAHPRPAGTDSCGQKDTWPRSTAGSACQCGDLTEDQGKQCLHFPGGVVNLSGRWQLGSRCQGKYQNF